MPKRSFIHGVFGDLFNPDGTLTVLNKEIKLNLSNKYQVDYIAYVFGIENEKYLKDLGVKTKLLDIKKWGWDKETELFRHKLEFYKAGMEDFDEIVYLDWDVLQLKPLTSNYWENLYKKEKIQGHIHRRRQGTCPWRKYKFWKNRLINAGILALRDNNLPNLFIQTWNKIDSDEFLTIKNDRKFWTFNDEIIIQYVIDHIYGFVDKIQGKRFFAEQWLKKFELEDSILGSFRGLKDDIGDNVVFNHLSGDFKRLQKKHQEINNLLDK